MISTIWNKLTVIKEAVEKLLGKEYRQSNKKRERDKPRNLI